MYTHKKDHNSWTIRQKLIRRCAKVNIPKCFWWTEFHYVKCIDVIRELLEGSRAWESSINLTGMMLTWCAVLLSNQVTFILIFNYPSEPNIWQTETNALHGKHWLHRMFINLGNSKLYPIEKDQQTLEITNRKKSTPIVVELGNNSRRRNTTNT